MKTLISASLLLLILLPLAALSQRRPDWFTIGQYNFEINLPSRPSDFETSHFQLVDYEVYGETFEWEGDKTATIGIYQPFKLADPLSQPNQASVIAAYAKVIRADLQKLKLAASESPYIFSGSKGIEIRAIGGDFNEVTRLFFLGFRLFAITVSNTDAPGFDRQIKILDSFRLLTKTETIAALKWENEPPDVSQTPAAPRLGNDLQDNGLKGNVCSVIDEVSVAPSVTRDIDRESYYNSQGNLVREVTYGQGYPQEITQWGWIDRKRISSTVTIFYAPPVGTPWKAPITLGPSTGMMGHAKRNAPFGMRHEYKYDMLGRITEQQAYKADGALNWTKKITNSSTGREILTLDSTGGFLTRFFETFDKNGNVGEYKILDMSGKAVWTHRYTYEFDQGGNWVVRRSYLGGAGRPKSVKPGLTVFRKITYCDDRAV